MLVLIFVVLVVQLVALLPDGRYRLSHERWVLRLLWLMPVLYWLSSVTGWYVSYALLVLGMAMLALVLLIVRYMRLPGRQQQAVRWLLSLALLAGAVLVFLDHVLPALLHVFWPQHD